MEGRKDIYGARGSSVAERVFLTMLTGAYVGVAWWLLFDGIEPISTLLNWPLSPGDTTRRLCLGIALTVYFIRLLFTQFLFLKRALSWAEAAMIGLWLLLIYPLFAIAGGTNAAQPKDYFGLGIILFLLGSWMNSHAEYARHKWKQRPENYARPYTLGLFRYSRHPNYLGDLI